MTDVRLVPVHGIPEVRPGDDVAAVILDAVDDAGLRLEDWDVVVVTQKIVSKAEGRVVPEEPDGKAAWVARETVRVVARRGDLLIAETRHGFVCANAGVDASNVGDGLLTLLPEHPDDTAERIRSTLERRTGASVGVVVTDTFGRPWRAGLVDVAIGCAGIPSLIDLRGTKDATGRVLEATVEALADEVAAAAGLVMGKADGVPVAIVRGLRLQDPPSPASALVRPPREDLFRWSPLETMATFREASTFAPGEVPAELVQEAVAAAWAGVPEGARPSAELVRGEAADAALVVSLAAGTPEEDVPALVQRLMLALHAQGLASRWDRDAHASAIVVSVGWPPP